MLELIDIERSYQQGDNETRVLRGLSLSIVQGEFVAVVGASGSGKSTLMNIMGCLDRPSAGRYLVDGQDVADLTPDELSALRRKHFGFVFQRYNLLADATAGENVEMPAIYADRSGAERRERAAALLNRLGMSDRLSFYPSQLSGGQQQRVSIARALMNDARVILADEPTGALDSASGREVLGLLKELNQAGRTVILITHDPKIAAEAGRVITISDGVITGDSGLTDAQSPPSSNGAAADLTSGSAARPEEDGAGGASFASAVDMALRSIKNNRFRSLLTLLGIVIGVGSVIAMLALGNGTKAKVLSSIESMGSDLLLIRPAPSSSRSSAGGASLVEADIQAMREVPGVAAAIGEDSGSASVRYENADYQSSVIGTGMDKPLVANWSVAQGEFFNEEDLATRAPVAVIGQTVAKKLFGEHESTEAYSHTIGQYILLNNIPFQVIGVMSIKGATARGDDADDVVMLPVTSAQLRLFGRKYLRSATVKAAPGVDTLALQASVQEVLDARHPGEEYRVMNTAEIMEAASTSANTLTVLLASVAAISLLVGGIGVMNIMLVSVTERTREIGIRMACGARRRDILTQFITEALVVCLLGGLIGIALGLAAAFIADRNGIAVSYTIPPVLLASSCACLTGLVFGFAPARKAARLDPVTALAGE